MVHSGMIDNKFLEKLIQSKDQKLILNSGGGCCSVMMAALDFLETGEWVTVSTGSCMSAAVPLIAAGAERYTTKRTRYMVHPGSVDVGTASAKEAHAESEEFGQTQEAYWEILGKLTKKNAKWWRDKGASSPFYFGAKEAKLYGIVDRVI